MIRANACADPVAPMHASSPSYPGNEVHTAENPPVVLIGGNLGSLSLLRMYHKNGIDCYVLARKGLRSTEHASHSRYAKVLPYINDQQWSEFLLGDSSEWLRGSLLLADNDFALRFIAENHGQLKKKYLLDLMNPAATRIMLNKLSTYRLAEECGIDTPRFWAVESLADIERVKDKLCYPVLLKPHFSLSFTREFKRKFLKANDYREAESMFLEIQGRGKFDIVLLELIPGPDSLIASYYSYVDENGRCLFDFTKTILRRYPVNGGGATYHIAKIMPEVANLGKQFLERSGYRGFAGVEFKLDTRDNKWKLIECNARFTAPTELLHACGCNVAMLVYNRVLGRGVEPFKQSPKEVRLWHPVDDLFSFMMLRKRGELSLTGWIKSLIHWNRLPGFSWSDPWPSVVCETLRAVDVLTGLLAKHIKFRQNRATRQSAFRVANPGEFEQ